MITGAPSKEIPIFSHPISDNGAGKACPHSKVISVGRPATTSSKV